jgi:hypothetical protein
MRWFGLDYPGTLGALFIHKPVATRNVKRKFSEMFCCDITPGNSNKWKDFVTNVERNTRKCNAEEKNERSFLMSGQRQYILYSRHQVDLELNKTQQLLYVPPALRH